MSESSDKPLLQGVTVHRDLQFRYSFLLASGWHSYQLESAAGRGRIFSPEPDTVLTSFSTEAIDLGTEITADDCATLRAGVESGLHELPDLLIEEQSEDVIGNFISLEYRFTFTDAATQETRKRWLRLVYDGRTQVRLIAQGASPAAFDYWLPVFFQTMRSFQFADWWGEIAGAPWQQSLPNDYPDE